MTVRRVLLLRPVLESWLDYVVAEEEKEELK